MLLKITCGNKSSYIYLFIYLLQYSFTNQEDKILIGWGAQRKCMHNAWMGRAATMHA
jgi:hypothetical protein